MKKITASFMALIMAAALTACSGSSKEKDGSGADEGNQNAVNQTAVVENTGDTEVKTLYGEVSDIAGNAITIKLIEVPQISFAMTDEDREAMRERVEQFSSAAGLTEEQIAAMGERLQGGEGSIELTEEQIAAMREQFQNRQTGRATGEAQGRTSEEGGEGQATFSGIGSMGARAAVEREYTGEEVDIIIPVGLSLTTVEISENGAEEVEMNVSKLKTGDIVTVTYTEDGKTIDKILVSSNSAGMVGSFRLPDGMNAGSFQITPGQQGVTIIAPRQ